MRFLTAVLTRPVAVLVIALVALGAQQVEIISLRSHPAGKQITYAQVNRQMRAEQNTVVRGYVARLCGDPRPVPLTAQTLSRVCREWKVPQRSAATGPLVVICTAQPCTDFQEFTVWDTTGAPPGSGRPIFSVPEFGGPGVYGDCGLTDFPPSTTPDVVPPPALVMCYERPSLYAADHPGYPAGCTAPAAWWAPGGIWICEGGVWTEKISLSP